MFSRHPTASALAAEHFGFAHPVDTSPAAETTVHGLPMRRQHTDCGTYGTLTTGHPASWSLADRRMRIAAIAAVLHDIAPERVGCTLVCGIGSRALTADALGPMVCERLPTFSDADGARLCVCVPGVGARTGIPTVPLCKAAAELCHAQRIIAVDALSAQSSDTLERVVQLSGDAITPGSGTGVYAEEISSRTMPCPVCTIGVPTVIRASALCGSVSADELFVTASDVDTAVSRYAEILAGAIARFVLQG